MLTTFSHLFKKPVTIQYPDEHMEMPAWTRGRPRLIYNVDVGDLRCTACGACAIACPVDVIRIEHHPGPDRKKVLDRFDIDMGGCIECALCVEACPFQALVMAPDFEMAFYDRADSLVFNMYELRIPGTPEVDAAMDHIIGVKRGLARDTGDAARAAGAAAGQRAGVSAATRPEAQPGPQATHAPAQPTAQPQPAAPAPARPGPVQIDPKELEGLSPAEKAALYKQRQRAAGIGGPAPKTADGTPSPAAAAPAPAPAPAEAAPVAPPVPTPTGGGGYLDLSPEELAKLSPADRAKLYKERQRQLGIGPAPKKEG
jgi:NADH-quinone oxidoreductase subunit I